MVVDAIGWREQLRQVGSRGPLVKIFASEVETTVATDADLLIAGVGVAGPPRAADHPLPLGIDALRRDQLSRLMAGGVA
jgi:hypothetical protein